MTIEIILILVIILGALVLFATEVISIDLTAMLVMVVLMIAGQILGTEKLISPEEGISGFSNTATITILALFILSAGLQATGAVNLLGRYMTMMVGKSQSKAMLTILIVVGFISAFINNTAVVVIFMPIIFRISSFTGASPSRFLMPLSFAAMIGGACTVIGTSTNILVSEIYANTPGGEAFGIFEFGLIGIVLFIAFFLYMYFLGDRLLVDRQDDSMSDQYELRENYITEIVIPPHSALIGKAVKDTFLITELEIEIVEVMHDGQEIWEPLPSTDMVLSSNDQLMIKVNVDDILAIQDKAGVRIETRSKMQGEDLDAHETTLLEVVIAPNSKLARKKIQDVDFYNLYGAVPLGIRRRGFVLKKRISDVILRFGDDILLEAKKDHLESFNRTFDFILTHEITKPDFERKKLILSVLIVLGVVTAAATNLAPILVASLTGCVLMFLTECLTIREAYRNIEWKIIFLLAGLLPLGLAIENSGAGALISTNLFNAVGHLGPTMVVSILFFITSMLTSVMSNNATAILLAPIAIGLSSDMGIDPKAFLITIMFAANTSFITPVGYQTNTLIYGPGNYRFSDFFKVGGLLTLIVWVIVTGMVHLLYLR